MNIPVCSACQDTSPIPAYVEAHVFGTYCIQCWELVKNDYKDWLFGRTPTTTIEQVM